MSAPDLMNAANVYQHLKPAFEPLRIAIAAFYGIAALAECYCDLSGAYERAGMKLLRMEYMQSRPWLNALAWLCLHTFILTGMLWFFWGWWRSAILILVLGSFLIHRVFQALTFRTHPDQPTRQ
jgi:hypothetical protein